MPFREPNAPSRQVLVHLAAGIGNVILATPLLVALDELGFRIHLALDCDYPQTADLFEGWALLAAIHRGLSAAPAPRHFPLVIPAVPPFYWSRYQAHYRGAVSVVQRPPDHLFDGDEQGYYLEFAWQLGYPRDRRPWYRLPVIGASHPAIGAHTVVMAPGCKTGAMAAKRWPHFAALAERFDDVVVVGTPDDLVSPSGAVTSFPPHVHAMASGLSLRQTAELLAAAPVVVANDSGLGHLAGALGTSTVMLFGPTPHASLGALPLNVEIMRSALPCQPCWSTARLRACGGSVPCLDGIGVDAVAERVRQLLPPAVDAAPAPCPVAPPAVARSAPACPFVTCIMPTTDRRTFVPRAIAYFLRQDYQDRELLVLDDGQDCIADLIPPHPRVRYERLPRPMVLGAKRNAACEMARGDLILHWDDDDWIAADRISRQVTALMAEPGADVCGLAEVFFYAPAQRDAWRYRYRQSGRAWVAGGTMCYWKRAWSRSPFPAVAEGEDTRFVWALEPRQVLGLPDPTFFVAIIHSHNTSSKRRRDPAWTATDASAVRALMGSDLAFYDGLGTADQVSRSGQPWT